MIDFHCHIDLYSDPASIVARCQTEKVYVLSVTTVPSAFEGTAALALSTNCITTAVGLHPELVATRHRELALFEELVTRTPFVGEVGLDGSSRHRENLSQQETILSEILRMCARAGGKVISLHSRGAAGKILDVLSSQPDAGTFVLHWYNGTKRQVQRAVELGCWFSVNPAMLSSVTGRCALSAMPLDRIVPESDGPFGTVAGRPAQPWDAWSIVPGLGSFWDIPSSQVVERLTVAYLSIISISNESRDGCL
jgi:TatD DNase family protein